MVKKPIITMASAIDRESRVNKNPRGMIGCVMKKARMTRAPQISSPAGILTFITSSRVTFSRSITFLRIRGITMTLIATVRAAAT